MKSLINILKILLLTAVVVLGMFSLNMLGEKYDLTAKQLGLLAFGMAQPALLIYISYCYLKDRRMGLKGSGKSWLIRLAGYEVIGIGLLLFAGNKSGLFPTFPFAGAITIGLGAVTLLVGSIYSVNSNVANKDQGNSLT